MPTPILTTKLYVPPARPKIVARPRLIERLNEGLHGKLTLISAPAGFGKTTLVSEWLASTPRPTAWLSLDEADSDSARFLAYLVAALQSVVTKLGEGVLDALQSPQPPPIDSLLTTLLNEIATITDDFVLVLDDYHLLDATAVDQAVAFVLDHMPPPMHLVITTREDPQLPLARLRARDQMTEVRASDLRFTPTEAAGFLNQVMGLDLSTAEVAALESRTEGWIAGLQLAAISMRGRTDVTRFVKAFAGDNRYIVDYLIAEVLQRQPENVRKFLFQTSILERLSGPLCDAVTSQDDSTSLLDTLERGNLFVVPLDDQRHWFRYHHLFAEVLAAHARLEQPAQVPIWHQRASAWYAANGLPADAIRHALAAKDFAQAAGLIEVAWPAMDGTFQSDTWLNWARSLPDELIRTRPVLSVAYGYAFMNRGELEAADARLQDAERLLETMALPPVDGASKIVVVDEEQFRTLPASIATARSFVAQSLGDLPNSVKYGQRVLDLSPESDHIRRGQGGALLGLAQWASGDLEAAYRSLAEAMASFQKAGNLHFSLSVTSGLVEIRTVQGRLREAVKVNTQALQLALAQGEPPLRGTADLHLGLSELLREQGDLEAAQHHLLQSETLGEPASLPDWRYHLCRVQARLLETQGDLAGALDRLDEAEGHYFRTPVPDVRPLAAMKARVWVAQGRLGEARRWVEEQGLSVDSVNDDELSFLREFDHITLARMLLAERAIPESISLLERLQRAAEAGGRMGSVIEIGVLQALAHQAQGDIPHALVALERALKLAEPEGYVGVFVDKIFGDEGMSMARLLSAAAAQGIATNYVGKLLAAFAPDAAVGQSSRGKAGLPLNEALIEPLSAREIEILHLVAQGLSNEEIGARLFLALSTVKGHNRNIFEKLQVQRRTEAVARARELGLL